jgi:sulfur carrier protein
VIVTVIGARGELTAGAAVARVVELVDVAPDARGVAVALDGEVVARSRWTQVELRDGALIEVVAAIQGG